MAKRSDPQAEAIVEGRHDNPFGYLGMHKSASGLRVRAMLPGAAAVAIVDSATGQPVAEALPIHPDGLFAREVAQRVARDAELQGLTRVPPGPHPLSPSPFGRGGTHDGE